MERLGAPFHGDAGQAQRPRKEKGELLGIIGSLKNDIVEKAM
ncbi:MAG: hypothetical protein ACREOG_20050 [Gemmatimonadaceae bacterium]